MTRETATQHVTTRLDTKLLSNFIYQMNIVRRQGSAYPPGHQVIVTAAERTLKVLEQLTRSAPQITIGIARDRLMLGSAQLDPGNPVYREYARALFAHGLVAVTIHRELQAEELCTFCRLLACKPDEMLEQNGLVAASAAAGIEHIGLTPLDFRQFQTREVFRPSDFHPAETAASPSPWDRFVGSLLASLEGEQTTTAPNDPSATPERLANVLSARAAAGCEGYDQAITTFLRDLDREQLSQGLHNRQLDRFRTFVSELQAPLRRQFLTSTFSALAVQEERAEEILSRFSNEILLDALSDLNERQGDIPPFILHLLSQLAPHGTALPHAKRPGSPADACVPLKLVFNKHRADDFVPEDYQALLRQCPARQPAPTLPPEVIEGLRNSIDEQTMEQRLCAIISHLLQTGGSQSQQSGLKNQLAALIRHFVATGDFASLADLHRQFACRDAETTASSGDNPTAIFASYHFTREIVRALSIWPPEKLPEIRELIHQVGTPFIPLLLDCLADEPDRTLRYQYLQLLGAMGPAICPEVFKRLHDRRWHLLRNLVVLLRGLQDPSHMGAIKPLLRHPHERVRREALKTAFHFRDACADPALLRELDHSPSPFPWAIGLARHSRDPRVFHRLLTLLRETGLSAEGLAVRLAVIASLGEIGNPLALTELEKTLFGFSLCHPQRHRRLQCRIAESLAQYPPETTAALRRRLIRSARPDLADLRRLIEPVGTGATS